MNPVLESKNCRKGNSIFSTPLLMRLLISSVQHFVNIMSSQALGLQGCSALECQKGITLCHCKKSSLIRTMSSCCANNGHGKSTEESQDACRPRQELQWDKLSKDEKNIYFVHKTACMNGKNSYVDPVTGYMVFTEEFLRKRRTCCGNGCRHCPYGHDNVPEGRRKTFNSAFYV